jgi:hypothetical protein
MIRPLEDPVGMSFKLNWGPEACEAYERLGHGMVLLVPRNRPFIWAMLVWPFPQHPQAKTDGRIHLLEPKIVKELLESTFLAELAEDWKENRVGWKSLGLPGHYYQVFVCLA